MKDFDILETPESVLIVMNCIGNVLKNNKFIWFLYFFVLIKSYHLYYSPI